MGRYKPDKEEVIADIHTCRVWTEAHIGVSLCHLCSQNQAMELAHEKGYYCGCIVAGKSVEEHQMEVYVSL